MNQVITDWCLFCEGKASFDDCHFYTLFYGSVNDETNVNKNEIREIYKYFPQAEKLIARMDKYFFEEKPVIKDFEKKKIELGRLIKLDFEERKPFLQEIGSFSKFNESPTFIYTPNFDSVYTMHLDDVWIQYFNDFLCTKGAFNEEEKHSQLFEALYGITNDYDYVWYLFAPLMTIDYSMEYLFQFRQLGGEFAITENAVYYSFK